MTPYIILFLASVFISSVSQIMLKKSTEKQYKDIIHEYINSRVLIAYIMFVVSTLLTMYAYKGVPLTLGTLLEAVGYIYIPILSHVFLNEKISLNKVIGSAFIIVGIIVYVL